MPLTVRVTLEVDAGERPPITASRVIAADALDRVEAVVEAGATRELEVQPAAAADVQLLVITSTAYGADLTFRAGGSTVDVALDQPQVYSGAGMIGRLSTDLHTITVDNGLAQDVTITCLAARTLAP